MMTQQFQRHYAITPGCVVQLAAPRLDLNGSRDWAPAKLAAERAWFRGNYRLSANDRVALFVGHDFRRKGLHYAIETIARTRIPENGSGLWKLVVVGLGKVREYIELAETLGLNGMTSGSESRVLFVGPTREMNPMYAAADALLLPTFYEPWSLVVPEALGHGIPVISTVHLGSADLVRQQALGTIVSSPHAVAEMAAALDALPLPGTPECDQLARRARAAGAGTSPALYVDALLALYDDIRKER